jgi:hypothetical protein
LSQYTYSIRIEVKEIQQIFLSAEIRRGFDWSMRPPLGTRDHAMAEVGRKSLFEPICVAPAIRCQEVYAFVREFT